MLDKSRLPNVSGFAQAGYGKPGYNPFSEDFSDYYMIGIRFRWNIYDWDVTKQDLMKFKEIKQKWVTACKDLDPIDEGII